MTCNLPELIESYSALNAIQGGPTEKPHGHRCGVVVNRLDDCHTLCQYEAVE